METIYESVKSCSIQSCILMIILSYYFASFVRSYVWTPFKLYVVAQMVPGCNLKDYGEWAVVTGATDGIGKEYAFALAKRGLNVVLISRSEEKLTRVKNELQSAHSVNVRIIVADFSGVDIYEDNTKGLEGLDIGVLVNNVGTGHDLEYFLDLPNRQQIYKDLSAINCVSVTMMSSIVLPQMVAKNKGVIVNVSSIAKRPSLMTTVYSATKSYVSTFTEGLQRCYCTKDSGIIIQLLETALVETNTCKSSLDFEHASLQAGRRIFGCQTAEYVESAINTIGWSALCNGHWKHLVSEAIADYQPISYLNSMQRSICEANRKRK